jgi:hypothetical protein
MSLDPRNRPHSLQRQVRAASAEDETGLIDDFRLYCGIAREETMRTPKQLKGTVMAATREVEFCGDLHTIVTRTPGSTACPGT